MNWKPLIDNAPSIQPRPQTSLVLVCVPPAIDVDPDLLGAYVAEALNYGLTVAEIEDDLDVELATQGYPNVAAILDVACDGPGSVPIVHLDYGDE